MSVILQWVVIALIGLGAVWLLARHFGLGSKPKAGCPGCNSCDAKPKRTVHRPS